jgi:rRNA maturation endonuclease Nob1
MKLSTAYVCYSCEEVLDMAPYGRCDMCGSADVYPLSWLGQPEEKRNRWVERVNGQKRSEFSTTSRPV